MSPPDPAAGWPDLAGRLVTDASGRAHVLPIRVYFEDTDFSGLVYHGSYIRWCERGRSDFLRLLGNDHRALIGRPGAAAAFVVRRMRLGLRLPASTRCYQSTAATQRSPASAAGMGFHAELPWCWSPA
jgi:hypothetical protein